MEYGSAIAGKTSRFFGPHELIRTPILKKLNERCDANVARRDAG
jgi:hypothetical protein